MLIKHKRRMYEYQVNLVSVPPGATSYASVPEPIANRYAHYHPPPPPVYCRTVWDKRKANLEGMEAIKATFDRA